MGYLGWTGPKGLGELRRILDYPALLTVFAVKKASTYCRQWLNSPYADAVLRAWQSMNIGLRGAYEAKMDVVVNGKSMPTAARYLSELVAEHAMLGVKVATALNGAFVAEASRAATPLQPGDRIEIVSPRQGG